MKYRMLVLDMDDTLLCDDLCISKDNIEALREANKKGITITVCSGRVSDSIVNIAKEIGITTDNDFYISYNGAVINDFTGKNIFYKPISADVLTHLIDIGREYGVDIQLYHDKKVMVEKYTSRTKRYEEMSKISVTRVEDLKTLTESIKILFNYKDIQLLEKMQAHIKTLYQDRINIFFSKPTYLEVLNKEANKGVAVEYLAQHLKIKQEEIIAVGDSFNDIYMIEYAGMGVAMNNARDEVKKIANYVTSSNNNDGGVSEVIHKFIL